VPVATVWYQKLCHFSVSQILSDWSNYGRQDLTDEQDGGGGCIECTCSVSQCYTVHTGVVLDRLVDSAYIVFFGNLSSNSWLAQMSG
jgi:hypothetical protein